MFDAFAGAKAGLGRTDGNLSCESLLLRMDYNRWFTVGNDVIADARSNINTGGYGGGLAG